MGAQVVLTAEELQTFANSLDHGDEVVLDVTCNTHTVVRILRPHIRRVVIVNPLRTRLIAEAKIKTDKVDAAVLAPLHASGFLPEVWMPDEATEQLRDQVARRSSVVQHRTRLKKRL